MSSDWVFRNASNKNLGRLGPDAQRSLPGLALAWEMRSASERMFDDAAAATTTVVLQAVEIGTKSRFGSYGNLSLIRGTTVRLAEPANSSVWSSCAATKPATPRTVSA